MTTTPVSKLLKELREEKGKSLRAVARDIGVDPAHLSRIERGKKTPSLELQEKVAHYYATDLDELSVASGSLPDDVIQMLLEHPEALDEIRRKYGRSRKR